MWPDLYDKNNTDTLPPALGFISHHSLLSSLNKSQLSFYWALGLYTADTELHALGKVSGREPELLS